MMRPTILMITGCCFFLSAMPAMSFAQQGRADGLAVPPALAALRARIAPIEAGPTEISINSRTVTLRQADGPVNQLSMHPLEIAGELGSVVDFTPSRMITVREGSTQVRVLGDKIARRSVYPHPEPGRLEVSWLYRENPTRPMKLFAILDKTTTDTTTFPNTLPAGAERAVARFATMPLEKTAEIFGINEKVFGADICRVDYATATPDQAQTLTNVYPEVETTGCSVIVRTFTANGSEFSRYLLIEEESGILREWVLLCNGQRNQRTVFTWPAESLAPTHQWRRAYLRMPGRDETTIMDYRATMATTVLGKDEIPADGHRWLAEYLPRQAGTVDWTIDNASMELAAHLGIKYGQEGQRVTMPDSNWLGDFVR